MESVETSPLTKIRKEQLRKLDTRRDFFASPPTFHFSLITANTRFYWTLRWRTTASTYYTLYKMQHQTSQKFSATQNTWFSFAWRKIAVAN